MDRPITTTLLRKGKPVWTRHYARLATAMRRVTELAITDGKPRDVFEVAHSHTGLQIGTVKVRVAGLTMDWIWDREPT